MALTVLQKPIYGLKNPSFTGRRFTASSDSLLVWPDAVKFAKDNGGVLQSADEAAGVRIEAEGADHAKDWQATRTGAYCFVHNGILVVGFADSPVYGENIVLARSQEGKDFIATGKEWILPKSDSHITAALLSIVNGQRFRNALESSPLELSLSPDAEGSSEFSRVLKPALPITSELYATWLRTSKERSSGYLRAPTLEYLAGLNLGEAVLVRPVGLGVGFSNGVVDAINQFGDDGGGFARGQST